MDPSILIIDPVSDIEVLKALGSQARISILNLLKERDGVNVNDIAAELGLPQSSVSSNIRLLEDAGLVRTVGRKARKGNQKVCYCVYDEFIVSLGRDGMDRGDTDVTVAMPLGLYTSCEVNGPCGICSTEGVIGLLDVPDTFLDPDRMKAALLWFTSGYVEYQFPNNAKLRGSELDAIEISMEVSSEVPGTNADWPSDITLSVNGIELGTWTSPGDFGDKRGVYTPSWWKLSGSQYGMLKSWTVNGTGTFVDGMKISGITLADLDVDSHRSIRLKVEVKREARHPGGVNIFGRGFGNYDQDIVMRFHTKF
ncbi:ArsR/SmtB family transcription factor [Tranquillimonas rosea]|uniref:ArsR/SmtB family transcription factor n=1 Tax=Tranquillimonas rosea TaxID=641238 RepID=UPI003BA9F104